MASSRRLVGGAGSAGSPTDIGSDLRSTPREGQSTSNVDMIDDGFGLSSGYSSESIGSYQNVYELLKDYPEWLARLDANPYKGFDVPASFWDDLGLSNKQKDKMAAYEQAYREYNAEILRQFIDWQNSLPQTQREQYVEAGYNADLMQVSPSSGTDGAPQVNASPDELVSGNSAEEIFQSIGTIMNVITAGVNAGLSAINTIKGVKKIGAEIDKINADVETTNLSNYEKSVLIAKTLYGDLYPETKSGELSPASKIVLAGAPKSVQDALDSLAGSRGFETAVNESVAASTKSKSDVVDAQIYSEQVETLYGSPQTWKKLRVMYNDAHLRQYEYLRDFYGALDAAESARASNAQSKSSADFFESYDAKRAGDTVNAQNNVALQSLRYQKSLIDQKLQMLSVRRSIIDSLFEAAQSERKGKAIAARAALLGMDLGSEYIGIGVPSQIGGSFVGASAGSLPNVPSM